MKAAIVYGGDYPFEGVRPDAKHLEALGKFCELIHPRELAQRLGEAEYTAIVNLHGKFFPKNAWNEILRHIRNKGGLVSVGAPPFTRPVIESENGFKVENAQTCYHRMLNIENIYGVKETFVSFETNKSFDFDESFAGLFDDGEISEFTVMFTHKDDAPHEHGSTGPMEANITPLVYALSDKKLPIAAPVILIENTKADFAGSGWIFYNQNTGRRFWDTMGAEWIKRACETTSSPVCEVTVRPELACYKEGELPVITLQYQVLADKRLDGDITISISHDGETVFEKTIGAAMDKNIRYVSVPAPITVGKGFYKIEAVATINGRRRTYTSGFWGYDADLLENGEYLQAEGDYFTKNGVPFPVNGMTYMSSDVHRKYLFLPNVSVWMKDFALMKGAGINLVRTGLWTNFRQFMFIDGIPNEPFLRAVDAFVSVAKYFDIEVVFNFFSFTPELWDGINPYLDPACTEAQKRFITSVAARHTGTKNLSWDLINEPSACNPHKIFRGAQPNRDKYELKCFRAWLKERYKTADALCEALNLSGADFETIAPPEDGDLSYVDEVGGIPFTPKFRTKTLLAADYTLFQNHVFDAWALEMKSALNAAGPEKLVTVGQDHATSGRRPHPFFHGQLMDYTCVHTWWQLDDLYWDAAFVKIPGKPALVQETGVMHVERADERYQRTEYELRDILERKAVYAYASNTAGVVPWILNTNIYMANANEVHIGMLRADQTEKPEFTALREIYGFIERNRHIFGNKLDAEVHMAFPFANSYSPRAYANIATRRGARVLTFLLNTPFFGCGDYQLNKLPGCKLLIYPSPRIIPNNSWKEIVRLASGGAAVLLTGPANFNEHWAAEKRTGEIFGLESVLKSVSREESVLVNGRALRAVFDGQLIGWVEKEVAAGEQSSKIYTADIGKGKLLWCPLPIEMNREDGTVKAVYETAMAIAGVENDIEYKSGDVPGVFIRKLKFDKGSIYAAISEDGSDREISFDDRANGARVSFKLAAGRSALIAVDAAGKIIDGYNI